MHRISLIQTDLPAPLSRCPYVRSSTEAPACVRSEVETNRLPPAPFLVGLSHQTAHVELRERFFSDQIGRMLQDLRDLGLAEAAVLFTCNRIEIYGVGGRASMAAVVAHLSVRSGMQAQELRAHLYEARDLDAARHLMRVAAGLESMVVGEPQILGQVAQALSRARAAKTIGPQLTRLFEAAVRAGRRARAQEGGLQSTLSVSDAAVLLARAERHELPALRVLVIGAGRMAALALKALQAQQVASIQVTSRNDDRALALASRFGASVAPFASLRDSIAQADVIIAAAAAAAPVFCVDDVPADGRGRLIIDLGVPRNVAPEVAAVSGVDLRGIDDLQQVVEQHHRQRGGDLSRARQIIEEHLLIYRRDSAGTRMGPVIGALRQRLEEVVDAEIDQAIRRLPRLDDEARMAIEQMRRRIVGKLLHGPAVALKAHQSPQVAQLVNDLFNLEIAGDAAPRAVANKAQSASASVIAEAHGDTSDG